MVSKFLNSMTKNIKNFFIDLMLILIFVAVSILCILGGY
jgi:hypothetical protein